MIRGTTPDLILTIPADLAGATVYVTLRQMRRVITLTGDRISLASDGEATTIAIRLTQETTLGLNVGRAEVQVRWITADGTARATVIRPVEITRVLLEKVVEYDAD